MRFGFCDEMKWLQTLCGHRIVLPTYMALLNTKVEQTQYRKKNLFTHMAKTYCEAPVLGFAISIYLLSVLVPLIPIFKF